MNTLIKCGMLAITIAGIYLLLLYAVQGPAGTGLISAPYREGIYNAPDAIPEAIAAPTRSVLDRQTRPLTNPKYTDVISATIPGQAVVWGTIQSASGEVLPGERVKLFSPSLNAAYSAVSNDHGEFVVNHATAADDYRISVVPRGMFGRFTQNIRIEANQTDVHIVLHALTTGKLSGRVIDIGGNPVRHLRLAIRSLPKSGWTRHVVTGGNGEFELDNVPGGEVEISSRSERLLRITGLYFGPDQTTPIVLVIDAGNWSVSGHVYDEHGEPLPGARVLLNWTRLHGQIRSVSDERTMTDASGGFTINDIGEGPHNLIFSFGRTSTRSSVFVGRDSNRIEAILHLGD